MERMDRPVVIVASDPALLSSLHFALSVEGFDVREEEEIAVPNACLVIDEDRTGGGLAFVGSLRSSGNFAPVILLVTHPDRGLRTRANRLGVKLLEKPLRHDDLSRQLAAFNNALASVRSRSESAMVPAKYRNLSATDPLQFKGNQHAHRFCPRHGDR
jgi:FixJ family two-component response regulator